METTDKHFTDDIQNTVAKLLAKEDVTVQRSYQYKTAFFDIKKRLMGLPVFKESFPREVYDLFIGHEVGHALWTTMEDAEHFDSIFHKPDLYNVLEDIRIERQIQIEYPGLRLMFTRGYHALWSRKFFGVQSVEEVNRLNFLDRLNIFAKLSIPVLFSDEEQPIVDEAMTARNIDEIIEVAHKIVKLTKNSNVKPQPNNSNQDASPAEEDYSGPPSSSEPAENETDGSGSNDSQDDNDGGETDSDEDGDATDTDPEADSETETDDGSEAMASPSETDSADDESESKNIQADDIANDTTGNGEGTAQSMGDKDPLESLTQKSFDETLSDSVAKTPCYNGTIEYVAPTKEEIYRRVIDYKTVMAARISPIYDKTGPAGNTVFAEYQKFVKDSKSAVSHLSNQFQQKKAAYQYSRSTQSTRGVIDVNSLYKYKYDENIFLSNTNLANAKSHGLVMMIDLSGSMGGPRIFGVIKQTLIMSSFCKKNSIPFSVYTWTDIHGGTDVIANEDKKTAFDDKLSLGSATVHCVLSSDMPKTTFDLASWELYALGVSGGYGTYSEERTYDSMGGTPICHTLLIASRLLIDLKKVWGVQVMNFMFLTDGDGYDLTKYRNCDNDIRYGNHGSVYGQHVGKLNGHRVTFTGAYQYKTLIQHITEDLKVNTIGIFETSDLDCATKNVIYNVMTDTPTHSRDSATRAIKAEFNKEQIAFRENCGGYRKFILIKSNVNSVEMDSKYDDGDVKSIQRDFMKVGANKKARRVFANQVIDTICSGF